MKKLKLLSKCTKNCEKCNSVTIEVQGHMNEHGALIDDIEGEIDFSGTHKTVFLQEMEEGAEYMIIIEKYEKKNKAKNHSLDN